MAELEATMTASEFADWLAFWEVEPWGPIRDNMHTGMLAAAMLNPHRQKGTPALGVNDFMFKTPQQQREERTQRALAMFGALATKKA